MIAAVSMVQEEEEKEAGAFRLEPGAEEVEAARCRRTKIRLARRGNAGDLSRWC